MGATGFFKGEKKKQKRERSGKNITIGGGPVLVLPDVITKKKKEY